MNPQFPDCRRRANLVIKTVAWNWSVHEVYDFVHQALPKETRRLDCTNGPAILSINSKLLDGAIKSILQRHRNTILDFCRSRLDYIRSQ